MKIPVNTVDNSNRVTATKRRSRRGGGTVTARASTCALRPGQMGTGGARPAPTAGGGAQRLPPHRGEETTETAEDVVVELVFDGKQPGVGQGRSRSALNLVRPTRRRRHACPAWRRSPGPAAHHGDGVLDGHEEQEAARKECRERVPPQNSRRARQRAPLGQPPRDLASPVCCAHHLLPGGAVCGCRVDLGRGELRLAAAARSGSGGHGGQVALRGEAGWQRGNTGWKATRRGLIGW